MKYNCVLCKTHGIDKRAETLTQFAGYEISVCQECSDKIHPENMILKAIIRNCLDQTLKNEIRLYEDHRINIKVEENGIRKVSDYEVISKTDLSDV